MKTYIFHNPHKEPAVQFRAELEEFLVQVGIDAVDTLSTADFFIVIGGDGTLLNFSKHVIDLPRPVLAINMGSLGFLTDVRVDEAFDTIKRILKRNFETEPRRLLEVAVCGKNYYALNDVVISKCGLHARMISVAVHAGDEYVTTYRADGVIIATPTGSTAYSFSTGGPIVKPGLNAMVITPIAPHNLNARPIVLPGDEYIELQAEGSEHEVHIMLDGQCYLSIENSDRIAVKLSDKCINLIKARERGYYSILREKLKWGDKLC